MTQVFHAVQQSVELTLGHGLTFEIYIPKDIIHRKQFSANSLRTSRRPLGVAPRAKAKPL